MRMFEKIFRESDLILAEGAFVERIKGEFNTQISNHINHAGLIYDKAEVLEILYRQYIDIGKLHNVPIMVMTPTRKVNYLSIKETKYKDKDIISDSFLFLNEIKKSYGEYSNKIMIGGLMGCKGDAYKSINALNINDSYEFHQNQSIEFQKHNFDFLFAGIMPEINEAIGMAKAMAETNIPYIISFMIRKDGCLIDGTPISTAISIIDEEVSPQPICYLTNCIHPKNLHLALSNHININKPQLSRFKGIQANGSILSPEELNNCDILHTDDSNNLIDEMLLLYKQFDLKIFGGCCGTDDKFIADLSSRLLNTAIVNEKF